MIVDGIDQSWGVASPDECKRRGIRVVSMYLSRDPSKNVTAAKVRAYHAAGVAVLLNWEAFAGAPLNGRAQGRADALDAVAQVRALFAAVGYAPRNRIAIPFSCDRDVTPAQYPQIDAYYAATKEVLGAAFLNGVYGEADLVDHLHAAGLTVMEWQTYAWSGGRLSPEADFYQFNNGQTLGGASVDFDRVMHADQLGAWWPPGHALNTATPTAAAIGDDDMAMTPKERAALIDDIVEAVWARKLKSGGAEHYASTWLVYANRRAYANGKQLDALLGKIDAVAKVLTAASSGILPRVAALQAVVAKLTPAAIVDADAAVVADAVAAKLRGMSWGAK